MIPIKPLTIGILAAKAEVNVETIRYYQRMELIVVPDKPLNGFRVYQSTDIDRVKFIKRAQYLGFTLKEIQELLDLGEGHCQEIQQLTLQKLDEIELRLKNLTAMRKALKKLLKECKQDGESDIHCALIDSLTKSEIF